MNTFESSFFVSLKLFLKTHFKLFFFGLLFSPFLLNCHSSARSLFALLLTEAEEITFIAHFFAEKAPENIALVSAYFEVTEVVNTSVNIFDPMDPIAVEEAAIVYSLHGDGDVCTYEMYNWSRSRGRSVNHRSVRTTFGELPDDGRDPEDSRCSICSENQVRVDLEEIGIDLDPIYVCDVYAQKVRDALIMIVESGEFEFDALKGYRPGRTRGRVRDGMRTQLSNHSYGTAIDVNAGQNGLYRSCDVEELTPNSIERCRLGIGGEWDPIGDPRRTVVRDGIVYEAFTEIVGWRWGGEISGSLRDIMHFSQTGY